MNESTSDPANDSKPSTPTEKGGAVMMMMSMIFGIMLLQALIAPSSGSS